jgi:hypothetical protein
LRFNGTKLEFFRQQTANQLIENGRSIESVEEGRAFFTKASENSIAVSNLT